MNQTSILCLAFGILLAVSGCSGNIKAGGTVSYPDGTFVDHGAVVFTDGIYQYTGNIQPDGTFRLGGLKAGDGLPAGTYKVSVIGVVESDGETPVLATKYGSTEESGIVFEVVQGKNEPFKITVERAKAAQR